MQAKVSLASGASADREAKGGMATPAWPGRVVSARTVGNLVSGATRVSRTPDNDAVDVSDPLSSSLAARHDARRSPRCMYRVGRTDALVHRRVQSSPLHQRKARPPHGTTRVLPHVRVYSALGPLDLRPPSRGRWGCWTKEGVRCRRLQVCHPPTTHSPSTAAVCLKLHKTRAVHHLVVYHSLTHHSLDTHTPFLHPLPLHSSSLYPPLLLVPPPCASASPSGATTALVTTTILPSLHTAVVSRARTTRSTSVV